jgi:hypothetical protein
MKRLLTVVLAAAIVTVAAGVAAAYENDNDYSTDNAKAFFWRQDEAQGGGG